MKRTLLSTVTYAIVLVITSVLSQIGNWPDNFFKTFAWIIPAIISFFIGMNVAAEQFNLSKKEIDSSSKVWKTICFSVIIVIFSIIAIIVFLDYWPRNWFKNTFVWWTASSFSFYLGIEIQTKFDRKNAVSKKAVNRPKEVVKSTPVVSSQNHRNSTKVYNTPYRQPKKVIVPNFVDIATEEALLPIAVCHEHTPKEGSSKVVDSATKKKAPIIYIDRIDFTELH